MSLRRSTNPGRRERAAGKRHKRTETYTLGSDPQPLKLGRKHLGRKLKGILTVADSRKASKSKRCD
jgi:hypothetical protein